MPGRRRAPRRGQPGPLGGPPDQRRRARGPVGEGGGDERFVDGAGFRRGIDAELVLQRRGAHVVGAHGAGPVPGCLAEPDQQPVALLAQGIPRDQALGAADGFGPALVLLVPAGEPLQRVGVQPGEPLPVPGQPFVIAALEQLTAVDLDRLLEPVLRQCPLELLDVQPQRDVRAPVERARPDLDQAIRVRQRAAQGVQHLAQVGLRLALGRTGPQQERQALPRLRRVPVQQQVGEQRFGPGRVQRRKRLVIELEVHGAEQPGAESGRAHRQVLSPAGPAGCRSSGFRSGRTGRDARRRPGRGRGCWRSRS